MAEEFGAHPIVINLHPYTVKERMPSIKFLLERGQNPEVILTKGLFSLGSFNVSSQTQEEVEMIAAQYDNAIYLGTPLRQPGIPQVNMTTHHRLPAVRLPGDPEHGPADGVQPGARRPPALQAVPPGAVWRVSLMIGSVTAGNDAAVQSTGRARAHGWRESATTPICAVPSMARRRRRWGSRACCVLAHSPQGCYQLVDAAFGWQDADYTETLTLCTKLCEDEIVHGGEELLARTILEAQELNVPIMFVLTACGPEIVGDDIVAVCEEMSAQVSFPIVPIQCAGFRGDQNRGTDIALEAILKHLVPGDGDGPARSRARCA